MGCRAVRSQSVYSFTTVEKISDKWCVYVLRTYVRSILSRCSPASPATTARSGTRKTASLVTTPHSRP